MMKLITLLRIAEFPAYGTFGVLMDEGLPICTTIERVWKNNQRGVSCIPEGEFDCKRGWYNRGNYATFEIKCLPREQVKFHKGNLDESSHGCIILGESFDPVWNLKDNKMDYGILSSGKAMGQFMDLMKNVEMFKLVIARWRG